MFFFPPQGPVLNWLTALLSKLFPKRVSPTLEGDGWLITYQPVTSYRWEPAPEPHEGCACHPGYVCPRCQAEFARQRDITPLPF